MELRKYIIPLLTCGNQMRITFLTSHFPELSEQFIINQVIGLLDAGVDVSILTLHNAKEYSHNPEFRSYKLWEKITSLSIPENRKTRFIKALPLILKLLFISPLKLFMALNFKRYNRAVFSLKTVYVLNVLWKEKIPLLHCHFGSNGVVGAFMKDAGIADKYIATFHGSDINSYPLRYGKNVYRHLFKTADCITVNTGFTGKKVVDYGCIESKIEIVPVGLKCTDYPALKKKSGFMGAPVILTVARLEEKKGHKYALNAFKGVLKKYPEAMYHLAGAGSLDQVLKAQAHEMNISRNVVFHGFCNREQIFELYKKASVFLLPSVTASNGDMEGQGLVLQEAQAVGLPVISTLHNGIPDGVINGKTGFLVREKDSNAIKEKIIYLKENPDEAFNMGRYGREFVLAKYDNPILSGKIISIYKKFI